MNACTTIYDEFASAVKYPEAGYLERLQRCQELAGAAGEEVGSCVDSFVERMANKTLFELEEQYIRTFDMNPVCSMDTGWQLFGEDYNRGLYMVRMREEMRKFDVPESTELPDHLTHVLPVLGRMDEEAATEFALACVIPAVKKTLSGLPKDNSYHPLIKGLVTLLELRYGVVDEEDSEAEAPVAYGCACKETSNG
jgi:nitrate reductase molybdenum cofactor assembly chaperone